MTAHDPQLSSQPYTSTGVNTWNDAEVIGDRNCPEVQEALAQTIRVMVAPHNRTPGKKWELKESTIRDYFEHVLTQHPVEKDKHSYSVVYSVGTLGSRVTHDHVSIQYAHRLKDQIEEITSFSCDIDGTDKLNRLVDVLTDLGCLASVYTSHSHAAKKTATGDRFRIIMPLAEPYKIPLGEGRAQAIAEWESRYVGLCELMGLSEIDASGMRLQQIMYPPRSPSEEAEFDNVVILGRLLTVEEMPKSDASKYKKTGPRISTSNRSERVADGEPPVLSDGFNIQDWFWDVGKYCLICSVLDSLGWDDRGSAEDGYTILCPNDAAHSNPCDDGDKGCWACEEYGGTHPDDENGPMMIITCQHDHCSHLTTAEMLALIGQQIDDGTWPLPDEYGSFGEMLCDPAFYPDEIDGEEINPRPEDYGVVRKVEYEWLSTPRKVKKAFNALADDDRAGDQEYAAIWAGIEWAGNKTKAVEEATTQAKALGWTLNEVKRVRKLGSDILKDDRKTWGREQAKQRAEEREAEIETGLTEGVPANLSMDIAEPLGDTLKEAMATLAHRYVLSDVEGKFMVVRKPDLDALRESGTALRSVIVAQSPTDFVNYHADRCIAIQNGDNVEMLNPAKEFLGRQKRASGLVFTPTPALAGKNKFNMYYGRTLEPSAGTSIRLHFFIYSVVCNGDRKKYDWLLLWMSHMVQFPGVKPGTAVVLWGDGGCGKSTFGLLLEKLAAPHVRTLSKGEHIVGRFAGEHLSTCVLAIATEAAFAGDPRVVREMKALVTQTEMMIEPKGLPTFALPSYLRVFIDTNHAHAVQIEGNGSERRFFVMKINSAKKGDTRYWNDIYDDLGGSAMAALLHDLQQYRPEAHGFTWDDVRTAPSTVERDGMRYQSLRPVQRKIVRAFLDGEITMPTPDGDETCEFDTFGEGPIKLASTSLRAFMEKHGDARNADDTDPIRVMEGLFGLELQETVQDIAGKVETVSWAVARQRRGRLGVEENVRYFELPPLRVLLAEVSAQFDIQTPQEAAGEGQMTTE